MGFSPGGTLDVVTRALADQLHEPLNRTVVVENKPGAGGKIAVDALRAAPADGSVAMLCPDFLQSIYPFVFNKLNYAAQRDILPASTVVEFPMALAVPATSPIKTFAEYAQWVRAHPEHANFGHAASGGPTHFLGLQIAKVIGTPLQDVPFQGAAPMIVNLVGGNVAAEVPRSETSHSTTTLASFACWQSPLRSARRFCLTFRRSASSVERSSPRWAYWPYACLLERLPSSSPNGALRSEKRWQPSSSRARSARSALWRRQARRPRLEPGSAKCAPSGSRWSKLRGSKRIRAVAPGDRAPAGQQLD